MIKFSHHRIEATRKAKEMWSSFKLMWQLKRLIARHSGTKDMEQRQLMRIKQISGSKAALLNPLLLQHSKTRLRKMLSKTSKIHVIKMKFKRTHQLLINMRLTFENSINSNRAKLMFMLSAYKKEIDNYRTEIAKSKDKTIKHLIKPLTNLEKTAPI
jgi:hypothetical protein